MTVLQPIEEYGFHLHKGDFQDALSLLYGLVPLNTTKACHCDTSFLVDHAIFWGFPIIRHNEVRDLTTTLLTEVCHNVATEPPLQPISAETNATANNSDDAHLDVKARGFWCRGKGAYFDVRVWCFILMPTATVHSVLPLLYTS